MGTPHVHAEVIKAWADGKQIQVRFPLTHVWAEASNPPGWDKDLEYRVKPETIRYRVALMNSKVTITSRSDVAGAIERGPGFQRWLTDWVEVEV